MFIISTIVRIGITNRFDDWRALILSWNSYVPTLFSRQNSFGLIWACGISLKLYAMIFVDSNEHDMYWPIRKASWGVHQLCRTSLLRNQPRWNNSLASKISTISIHRCIARKGCIFLASKLNRRTYLVITAENENLSYLFWMIACRIAGCWPDSREILMNLPNIFFFFTKIRTEG